MTDSRKDVYVVKIVCAPDCALEDLGFVRRSSLRLSLLLQTGLISLPPTFPGRKRRVSSSNSE